MAKDRELGGLWLGIFRDDLSESLLATVANMEHAMASSNTSSRSDVEKSGLSPVFETGTPFPLPTVSKLGDEKTPLRSIRSDPAGELACMESATESCTLVVAKPIRQSLRSWSGYEDVMKVALEMAKHVCQSQVFSNPGYRLEIPNVQSFKRIIRFGLVVYVPGVLWKADTNLDYILTEDLDLTNLYRDLLKIYHLCSELKGL